MKKTIFISGASSGIGSATAHLFLNKGWNVIATMRNPEKQTALISSDQLMISRLDVVDSFSHKQKWIIINVSSLGGRVAMPLGSLYRGTIFAVEGISEALSYEVEQFGG